MTYPVTCACGKTHPVAGSAAGTTFACGCGRAVEVPSFARLKASVGQSTISADFELEQLLQSGRLPLETACVVCDRPTTNQVVAKVTCEREEVAPAVPWYQILWSLGSFWSLVRLAGSMEGGRSTGTDRIYPVPIRACGECALDLTGHAAIRDALLETPVYAGLLHKYPDAHLSLYSS